jgi:hypothetical protein
MEGMRVKIFNGRCPFINSLLPNVETKIEKSLKSILTKISLLNAKQSLNESSNQKTVDKTVFLI